MPIFGKSKRRAPTGPTFDFRQFETTDARQYALDDYLLIPTFQSGSAGLMPLYQGVAAAQPPSGFDWFNLVTGYGGNQAPVGVQMPLIDNPAIAQQFIEETS